MNRIHLTPEHLELDELNEVQQRVAARWGWPLPLMAGADDDDDDSDDDDADDDNDDSDDDDDDASSKGGSDDDDDADVVRVPRSEHAAMRKELAQRRRAEKKAQMTARKAAQKKAAEEGRFKDLLDEKDEELVEAKKTIADLEGKITKIEGGQIIIKVAKRLNFEDPDDAEVYFARYAREGEEITNEANVETVLKRILKDKPKLKSKSLPTGGPSGGGTNGKGKYTWEDIQQMSESEVNAHFNEPEFQAVLTAGPSR